MIKKKHFLIGYDYIDNKSVVIPGGMSGCGIWTYIPIKPQEVWTTNLRLLGVQNAIYKDFEVLRATRIERVNALLEKL